MKIFSTSLLFVAALALPVSTPVAQSQDLRAHPLLRPPIHNAGQKAFSRVPATPRAQGNAPASVTGLFRGFTGLTHREQRFANNGNQFSTVPPDQGLAVGNGFIIEAINSAMNVFNTSGIQQIHEPASGPTYPTQYPLALTEFFGLPSAFDRKTGTCGGTDPFDPVAIFDPETQRWFVVADNIDLNPNCTSKPTSEFYIGVSQTSDPAGAYYVYTVSTTDAADPDGMGARFADYEKIGVDHNVVVVSGNEFQLTDGGNYIGAAIYVFSKATLEAGPTGTITAAKVIRKPFVTGYEFTILPQMAPPGTAYVTTNGGTLYFVSGRTVNNTESTLGVWALTKTSTPASATLKGPAVVNTQPYNFPSQPVTQKDGFRPLTTGAGQPLETIDSGDFRMGGQNIVFTNSQLMCTLATEETDSSSNQVMAAAWFVLHPTISGGTLSATLTAQGKIMLNGASFLRPAIAFNTQLFGSIVGTQVGPNDFPTAAFVSFNGFTPGSVTIARAGNEPADEFDFGTCRWGDYSAAMVDSDNAIVLATEYIPDIDRSASANWATYIIRNQLNH